MMMAFSLIGNDVFVSIANRFRLERVSMSMKMIMQGKKYGKMPNGLVNLSLSKFTVLCYAKKPS
jgi:hypothetical protein